jgi:amino acid adenylation domain-containing protein
MKEGRSRLSTALAVGQNEKEQKYWLEKLEGYSRKVAFPYDPETEIIPADTMESVMESVTLSAPDHVMTGLERVGKGNPHAVHVVLTAAVQLQLNKYTGAEDIVLGTPIYRQGNPGTLINSAVAIRTAIEPCKNFKNMLIQVRETVVEAIANQNYPLKELVEKDCGSPLYDTAVVLENIQDKTYLEYPDLNLVMVYRIEDTKPGKRLQLQVEYNPARYREETVRGIIFHNIQLLNEIVTLGGMDKPVKQLDMQSNESKRRILQELSGIRNRRKTDKTLHRLFEEQAVKTPDRIAVVGRRQELGAQEQQLTYRELNRKANRLAYQLRRLGVRRESVVGIMVERTPAQVVGILGIMKAGGAYLPLDPDYPEKRLRFMLKDCRIKQLVADHTVSRLTQIAGVNDILEINSLVIGNPVDDNDQYQTADEPVSSEDRDPPGEPGNLVYVMYTSGSTGNPVGVMVEHRSVVRLVNDPDYIQFDDNERILQTGTLSHDASTFEIWGALTNGLSLYQATKEDILAPGRLKRWVKEWQITVMWMTSALFNRMSQAEIEIFPGLRWLLVGEDVLSPHHIHRIMEHCPGLKILYGYGPTENTTFSTVYRIENDGNYKNNSDIPIGKPVNGSTAYIVDPYGNPQPEGVIGELAVGGEGIARGYLNNPELTAKSFVPSSFTEDRSVLYMTGDRAIWMADGNIRLRGRKDRQVKIWEFKVEPGEIENRIIEHDAVKETVVVDVNRKTGEKFLVAYVVPDDTKEKFDETEIKEYLHHRLPDYMIPSRIIAVPEIPRTPNKKVDRAALPEPDADRLKMETGYRAPQGRIEIQVAEIVKKELHLDDIGVDDNFFDLGGNSLTLLEINKRLKEQLGIDIPIMMMFQYPTVKLLTTNLQEKPKDNSVKKTDQDAKILGKEKHDKSKDRLKSIRKKVRK